MRDRFEYIVNLSRDFITLINRDYRYELINDSYCASIGKQRDDLLQRTVGEVWGHEKFDETIKAHLDRCLGGEEVHYIDTFAFGTSRRHMHVSFFPFRERGEEITHVLVFSHDITRLGEAQSRLAEYEYRDPLTGLFNRRSLDEILHKEIEQARRARELRALLFVSLKNFKRVNQTHGHNIGDLLLESSAGRIQQALRTSDYVFRFDGSNFVVLLTRISRTADGGAVAHKIMDAVTVPYRFRDTDITIDCRIGISLYPNDGDDPDRLIQEANSASVEADATGTPFLYYDRVLHTAATTRMRLHTELLRSFELEQLELYYQPIVRYDAGAIRIEGAEALIRWHHPQRGLVGPGDFIEMAEQTGTVASIDKWALFQACERLTAWRDRPWYVSINLSPCQFSDTDLPSVIDAALRHAGLADGSRLKIEITERRCMEDPQGAAEIVRQIRKTGVDVWMDDFGTGQSSLAWLKRLPIETLKIDRELSTEVAESESDREFLRGIIAGITALNKRVIAEGVSTHRLAEVLANLGIPLMQGFLFGHPVPAEEFEQLLDSPAEDA